MKQSKKKLRPLGDITQDLEPLLFEMVDNHALQKGEVLALISVWIDIHYPLAIEVYENDNTSPEMFYGKRKK